MELSLKRRREALVKEKRIGGASCLVSSGLPENKATLLLSVGAMAKGSHAAPTTFPGSLELEEEE